MKMVRASVMKIPPSAVRPVVTRELYPPPPVPRHPLSRPELPRPELSRSELSRPELRQGMRPGIPPVNSSVDPSPNPQFNQGVARRPELPAPASIPEALLRRAIREELRELSAEQAAQARARAQDRQARVQSFVSDPWDDGFGQEETAASPNELAPSAQVVPAQAVAPLTPMPVGTPQTAIVVSDGYGPLAQMSRNLRIQAADGFRAGVIRLKNGMFLVVEIAQEALEPEFGVAEVLAPLVFNAAARALEDPETQQALINVASQGAEAVGLGIQALTHRVNRPHSPRSHLQHPHAQHALVKPRPVARPMARPLAAPATPYAPWPGQYQPPGYLPWQAPASHARTSPPQQPLRQASLPWADEQDFAGLLDESDGYTW